MGDKTTCESFNLTSATNTKRMPSLPGIVEESSLYNEPEQTDEYPKLEEAEEFHIESLNLIFFNDVPSKFSDLLQFEFPIEPEKKLLAHFFYVSCLNGVFINDFQELKHLPKNESSPLSNLAHHLPNNLEGVGFDDIYKTLLKISTTFVRCTGHSHEVNPFICIAKNFILETTIYPIFPFFFTFIVENDVSDSFIKLEFDESIKNSKEGWFKKMIAACPVVTMSYFDFPSEEEEFPKFEYSLKVIYFPKYLYVYNDNFPENKFALPSEIKTFDNFRYQLVSFIIFTSQRYESYKMDSSNSRGNFFKSSNNPPKKFDIKQKNDSSIVLMVFFRSEKVSEADSQ